MSDEQPKPKIPITDKRRAASGDPEPAPAAEAPPQAQTQAPDGTEELQRLADDRLDQLMRLKADFENFRQRELREKTELVERASMRIVERLLPVVDDLERALDAARAHQGAEALIRGVELVHQQLHAVLSEEGLERVAGDGPFDPEHHEAVASVPGDVDEPRVLEVVRPGYKLKGRTIRPALVQVSVPRPDGEESGG